jgi:hypothetical protein
MNVLNLKISLSLLTIFFGLSSVMAQEAARQQNTKSCKLHVLGIGVQGSSTLCGTHEYNITSTFIEEKLIVKGYQPVRTSFNTRYCNPYGVSFPDNMRLDIMIDPNRPPIIPNDAELVLAYSAPWTPYNRPNRKCWANFYLFEAKNGEIIPTPLQQGRLDNVTEPSSCMDTVAKVLEKLKDCKQQ